MEQRIYKLIKYATYAFALIGTAALGFMYAEKKADHVLTEGHEYGVLDVVRTVDAGASGDGGSNNDAGNDADDAW